MTEVKKHNFIKSFCVTMVMAFLIFGLSGCGKTQTIKSEGMEITLSKEYQEQTLANATWYYTSPDGIAMGIRSKKNDIEKSGLEVNSSTDYALAYIKANSISGSPKLNAREKYVYFEYSRKVSGAEYKYLNCFYDHGDSYWLVSFACYKALYNEYKADFFDSADSVVFDE